MAQDTTGFHLGTGLVEIATLTTLIGSSSTSHLLLGSRGAAGLPWAAISAFGGLSIVRECITGACPGWIQDVLAVRSIVSDLALGFGLDLSNTFLGVSKTRSRLGEAIGITCKNYTAESKLGEKEGHEPQARDIYAFDGPTSKILKLIPDSKPGNPLEVHLYADLDFPLRTNLSYDWPIAISSAVKMLEVITIWKLEGFTLSCVSCFTWLYFFVAAVILRLIQANYKDNQDWGLGEIDVISGLLPIPLRPGGNGKIFIGAFESEKHSRAWKIAWGLGAIVTTSSTIATYVILGRASNQAIYVWAGFQTIWLLLRLLIHHFTEVIDPMASRVIRDQPTDIMSPLIKQRVLALAVALAKYQTYHHPRGVYSYQDDLLSAQRLIGLFAQVNLNVDENFPLDQDTRYGSTCDISVVAVLGDTLLSSIAWIRGSEITGMDLYDSCLIFFNVGGIVKAVPAVRVLAGMLKDEPDEESNSGRTAVPRGTHNFRNRTTWWFWVSCGQNRWLQYRADDLKILGSKQATLVADAEITKMLQTGQLFVSLTSSKEVKLARMLSFEVMGLLKELL